MTYHSLSIQLYHDDGFGIPLTVSTTKSETLADLGHLTSRCGIGTVTVWAEKKGLKVFYVDNCWARVPVSQAELNQFADEVLGEPEMFAGIASKADGQRVIEAEEF